MYLWCSLIYAITLSCLAFSHSAMSLEGPKKGFEGTKSVKKYAKKYARGVVGAELGRLRLIEKFLPKNPTILEAGGFNGEDSVKIASIWPRGHLITFEPNPLSFQKLIKTTERVTNIQCYNLALNDYNGTAILNICYGTTGDDPSFAGASSLLEPSEEMRIHYQGPKVEIPCVILDDWCKDQHIDNIDFMWLDLEGFELTVLKSSPGMLSKVKVIYTETNLYSFREGTVQYQNLKEFLELAGFQLFAHWYDEGIQGDAIFIKKQLFESIEGEKNKKRGINK